MKTQPPHPSKTGIYWTQFPTHALTGSGGVSVDWTDHRAAHRAVSRLFSPTLPGDSGARRAEAGILYRLDVLVPGEPAVVLVQSRVPPELTPQLSRTIEVNRRAWDFADGDRVAVRLAVNPVRRTTRHYLDAEKTRLAEFSNQARGEGSRTVRDRTHTKQTASVVPISEVEDWAAGKLDKTLEDVEVVNHFRDIMSSGPQKLVVDTFDLLATVADAPGFHRLRVEGIGRAKAYGCGLVTARRLG